jgi:hypothetical protein
MITSSTTAGGDDGVEAKLAPIHAGWHRGLLFIVFPSY